MHFSIARIFGSPSMYIALCVQVDAYMSLNDMGLHCKPIKAMWYGRMVGHWPSHLPA